MKEIAIKENHLYNKAYTRGKRFVGKYVAVYVLRDLAAKRLKAANPSGEYVNRVGLSVSKKIGGACLDVYEEEADVFYEDYSSDIIDDDTLAILLSMPNVLVTSHQAFLTDEALENIAQTTVDNIIEFFNTGKCENEVTLQ